MGMLWPGLMSRFGEVYGFPFTLEGFAFFLEAIFVGIYLFGWDRLSPRAHLLSGVPMLFAGVAGAVFVVSANAWMNTPTGFRIVDGQVTDVKPWSAMFNDIVWWQFGHMWVAAYMVVGFTVAAVYAVGMLRGRRNPHHRLGFMIPFVFASAAAVVQPVVGHLLGGDLGDRQPSKLAAFELATTTESPSPLRIGGVLVDGQVYGAIDIPVLGSVIAQSSFTKPVPGLDTIPPEDQPPVNLTHWAFQTMVGLGTLLALGSVVFWFARWRRRDLLENRWFLRAAAVAGPLAILTMEAGWVATEVGRQPWTVYGVLRTSEAAGDNPALWWLLAATVLVYGGMTVGATVILRSMARRWREGQEDLPSPYGPQARLGDAPVAAGRSR
jgi:cytochrome d ubiquinol oxidase subunit I